MYIYIYIYFSLSLSPSLSLLLLKIAIYSEFSHEKWWIFPSGAVMLKPGRLKQKEPLGSCVAEPGRRTRRFGGRGLGGLSSAENMCVYIYIFIHVYIIYKCIYIYIYYVYVYIYI